MILYIFECIPNDRPMIFLFSIIISLLLLYLFKGDNNVHHFYVKTHTILKFRGWRRNWIGRPLVVAGMADEFRWRLGRACAGYPNISPSSVNVYTLQLLISTAGGNDSKQGKLKANQVGSITYICYSIF